ncbi:hypothetical protein [Moritella sp.]|uniref:hypothetical protein n=1 Tax=Moritella sp. TaxID=78556 RepID=UPI001DDB6963|nr:hypothetical protein [Moritella sp.]MCJ8350416.1 hypothetical protein [Moritella sp.]NQZ40111.1 hypothetical protein [Moritella sp.]
MLNQVDIHTLSAKYVAQHVAVVLQEMPAEFGFTVKEVIAMAIPPTKGCFQMPQHTNTVLMTHYLKSI